MSGRIKLMRNGKPLQVDSKLPEIPYDYNEPSTFDKSCGTFGLSDYQLPNSQCPEKFVCNKKESTVQKFAECLEAMNCHMFTGMTTSVSARSEAALFLHQMIPHHQNAVNMAKTLLKLGDLECETFDEEEPDCVMYAMGISIVASQNFQIQKMRYLLTIYGFPETDDCIVPVTNRGLEEENLISRNLLSQQSLRSIKRVNRLLDKQHAISQEKELPGIQQEEYDYHDKSPKDEQISMVSQQEPKSNNRVIRERKVKDTSETGENNETTDENICTSSTGRYTVRVNLNAGELGKSLNFCHFLWASVENHVSRHEANQVTCTSCKGTSPLTNVVTR
jgi:hypothetical protein